MSTIASNQAQDPTLNPGLQNNNEIKDRKPPLNHDTRAPSSPAYKLPAMQAREAENSNKKNPLSPRANPTQQGNIPQLGSPGNVTRQRATNNDANNPSGKSFYRKMEFIDNLLNEMDGNVSLMQYFNLKVHLYAFHIAL